MKDITKKIKKFEKEHLELIQNKLGNPLLNLIDNDELKCDSMKFVQAPTGVGKTHFFVNKLIPKLFEKGVTGIVYTCPTKDALASAETILREQKEEYWKYKVPTASNALFSMRERIPYDKFILFLCNQSVVTGDNWWYLRQMCKHKNIQDVAFFADEIHQWFISAPGRDREEPNRGNVGGNFTASIYNEFKSFANKTKYVFGATATPNLEQIGKMECAGSMDYIDVNKKNIINKKDLIFCQKWIDTRNSRFLKSHSDIELGVKNAVNKIISHNKKYEKFKKTLLIQCRSEPKNGGYERWTLRGTFSYLSEILPANVQVCIMNKDGNTILNNKGYCYDLDDDSEVFSRMEQPDDPLTILLVDQKGQSGINVSNLGGLVALKKSKYAYKTGGYNCYVPNSMLQLLGRMVRIYPHKDFLGNVHSLHKYCLTASDKQKTLLYKLNSFFVYAMNTPVNRLAHEIFTKGKSKAFVYFDFEKYHQTRLKFISEGQYSKCKTAENCARVYRDYPSYCNTLNEARKAVRELIKSA